MASQFTGRRWVNNKALREERGLASQLTRIGKMRRSYVMYIDGGEGLPLSLQGEEGTAYGII